MHPAIAAFPSAEFYDGRLKTKFDNKPVEFDWPDPTPPLAFLHVEGKERRSGSSYSNQEEVEAVKLVLGRVFSSGQLPGQREQLRHRHYCKGQWEDW